MTSRVRRMSRMLRDTLGMLRVRRLLRGSVCFFSFLMFVGGFPHGFSVSVWAAVDQSLSDRIAKAVGAPSVAPLKAKSAAESVKFRRSET